MSALRVGSIALWVGRPGRPQPSETVLITDILPPRSPGEPPAAYEVRFLGDAEPQWVSPYALIDLEEKT